MPQFDLLKAVQPDDGMFAIVGIKEGSPVRQLLVETREEADEVVDAFLAQKRNVFFGVAKYATDEGRTKSNVRGLKSLWLDVDCGEGKPYASQEEGAAALREFCGHIGLPKPIIVDSGRGLHVYWPLSESVSRQEWEPVMARLQALCTIHEFHADPACFEAARILRVPGTYNFKGDEPLEVSVLSPADPTPLADLKRILGVKEEVSPLFGDVRVRSGPSYLQRKMEDNSEYSFSKVLQRSLAGNGCNQIKSYYENRDTAPYDEWFRVLTVAAACDDRATAIHIASEGHEGYDPELTEDKASTVSYATSCTKFNEANPDGCADCPFKGKISSPRKLGQEILEATEEDNIVSVEAEDDDEEPETYTIPQYPFPYFRGKTGGIYRNPPPDAEESEPVLIYEEDLYVVKRMRDPEHGDVAVLRHHTPMDGVREFVVPMFKVVDSTELRKALASEGVVASKKKFELITDFINLAIKDLMKRKRAEKMRLQFGWADNDSKFIIGDVEISVDGNFHSPPSASTRSISQFLGPVGDYDKWREVFNLYDTEGLEPHAFAALTAFGAPLLRFLGQSGALINLIHPNSGTGKTTILHMCNSVWGHPSRLCAVKDDTLNAKIMRLGIMNNLPIVVDEMTNTKPEELSAFTYCVSQGRGKDRVKASSNELRNNATSWQTIALCSSNSSFYEKLGAFKNTPDGEMMRLMEFKIDYTTSLEPAFAKKMFDHQLLNNYGHAGPRYARWLLENRDDAKKLVLSTQAKIDSELGLMPRERFWSAVAAANITGGLIAKHLGLLDWDMKRLYKWVTHEINAMRFDVKAPIGDAAQVIGDYINRHIQHVLVVDDGVDRRTKMSTLPLREPKGELLIRYEPDTKKMFIVVKHFKSDCVKHQINLKDTLRVLKERGILLDTGNKRITKGLNVPSTLVQCHTLDCSAVDFNMDSFVEPREVEHAGGEC